jgi:hypothetical protein
MAMIKSGGNHKESRDSRSGKKVNDDSQVIGRLANFEKKVHAVRGEGQIRRPEDFSQNEAGRPDGEFYEKNTNDYLNGMADQTFKAYYDHQNSLIQKIKDDPLTSGLLDFYAKPKSAKFSHPSNKPDSNAHNTLEDFELPPRGANYASVDGFEIDDLILETAHPSNRSKPPKNHSKTNHPNRGSLLPQNPDPPQEDDDFIMFQFRAISSLNHNSNLSVDSKNLTPSQYPNDFNFQKYYEEKISNGNPKEPID